MITGVGNLERTRNLEKNGFGEVVGLEARWERVEE